MKFINTLQKILKDKRIAEYISSFDNSDIYFASSIIGEAINYCIIHQSDKNIKTEDVLAYIKVVNGMKLQASKIKDKAQRDKFFQTESAKIIAATIAKSLNIDLKKASNSEILKIKQYFLKNYIENGFVFHSFPTARRESVKQHGFTIIQKLWDNDRLQAVIKILEKHGAIAAMGGASYYNPNGMYVEHSAEMVLFHCLSAPEWFKFFTSSEHNGTSFDVATSPFYVKNYDACRQNVDDLITNLNLNEEESAEVSSFFESCWDVLKDKTQTAALIRRKTVGKTNPISDNTDLLTTITEALSDTHTQFSEHVGNVVDPQQITASDVELIDIPPAETFLKCDKFHRETKQELFNPRKTFKILSRGLCTETINLTLEQYSACVDAMEETFKDDNERLGELDKCKTDLYTKIEQSPLPKHLKEERVGLLDDYENSKQNKHEQNEQQENGLSYKNDT